MSSRDRLHWLAYLVSMLTVAATGVTMMICIWLYFFDANPPITYNNVPFPTDKSEYRIGEDIYVRIDYCKGKAMQFDSTISFVDGLVFVLPETHGTGLAAGCHNEMVYIATVPDKLIVGEYHLHGTTEYKVNILRTRTVEWTTTKFQVVK